MRHCGFVAVRSRPQLAGRLTIAGGGKTTSYKEFRGVFHHACSPRSPGVANKGPMLASLCLLCLHLPYTYLLRAASQVPMSSGPATRKE